MHAIVTQVQSLAHQEWYSWLQSQKLTLNTISVTCLPTGKKKKQQQRPKYELYNLWFESSKLYLLVMSHLPQVFQPLYTWSSSYSFMKQTRSLRLYSSRNIFYHFLSCVLCFLNVFFFFSPCLNHISFLWPGIPQLESVLLSIVVGAADGLTSIIVHTKV